MNGNRVYLLFALLVLGALGAAEYRGWGFSRPSEVRGVPRSVRNNPGAYRPVYVGGARYPRGK